jgi:hypothetical protein
VTGKALTARLRAGTEGESAASFYAGTFKDSKPGRADRHPKARPGAGRRGHGCRFRAHEPEVRLQEENDVLSAEADNDMLVSVREHLKALDAPSRVPRPERMLTGLRGGDRFSRASWPGYCRVVSRPDPPPWPHPCAGGLARRGQSSGALAPGPTGGGCRRKTP